MDATEIQVVDEAQTGSGMARRLLLSDWLWHPWYAKLWWTGMVIYWTGFGLSFGITVLDVFYSTALAGYLNVVVYPPVILMVLGTGFVRAKIGRGDWVIIAGEPQIYKPHRSDGGSLDPYSDPLDPRSGSLWVGSPQSRARLFGRKWP